MGERSINVVAKRNTGGEWTPKELYSCGFTKSEGVGCEAAEITVPDTGDLPDQLDMLLIYEDLTLLWLGRIEDKPERSDTGEVVITAVGYSSALKDDQITKLWTDRTWSNWDTSPSFTANLEGYAEDAWEWCERDNNNRIFIRRKQDDAMYNNIKSGVYYTLLNGHETETLHSINFSYKTGDAYDATTGAGRLVSFSRDFKNPVTEFDRTGTGPHGLTYKSNTLTANKTGMAFLMSGLVDSAEATFQNWFKVVEAHVIGDSAFTGDYTYKEIIDDILTNYATGISTDFSQIATGTVNIRTFYADDPTYLADIITSAAAGEDVSLGFYDLDSDNLPRLSATAINRTTVNWIGFQDEAKLETSGQSIQELFNQVKVIYDNPNGESGKRTLTYTVSDAGLTDPASLANASITRTAVIDVSTASTARAKNTAKAFLTESIKQKARGQVDISNDIFHTERGKVSAISMNPNDVIQLADVEVDPDTLTDLASSTNILNGKNVFRITNVTVDCITKQVSATIDSDDDRLDEILGQEDTLRG